MKTFNVTLSDDEMNTLKAHTRRTRRYKKEIGQAGGWTVKDSLIVAVGMGIDELEMENSDDLEEGKE